MQKSTTILALLALGTLASGCQALTLEVSSDSFSVSSVNTNAGSHLNIVNFGGDQQIDPVTPFESNLALGQLFTNFFTDPPQPGTYNFTGSTPPVFNITVQDFNNPAHTLVLPVTSFFSGSTTVNSSATGGSGNPTYTITSVGGSTTVGAFDDSQPAILDQFDFFGQTLLLKVRIKQSPPVDAGSPTGIEGRIQTVVPEPGAVAMLVGCGISGSMFMLRRRHKA